MMLGCGCLIEVKNLQGYLYCIIVFRYLIDQEAVDLLHFLIGEFDNAIKEET